MQALVIHGLTENVAQELREAHIQVITIYLKHIGSDIVQNAHIERSSVSKRINNAAQEVWSAQFRSSKMKPAEAAEIIRTVIKQR